LKYDSDFGPGVQIGWEHRKFTGRGDSLRFARPVWMDMQEVTARYRLPYFLRNDQAFNAQAGMLQQNTDAYELQSVAVAAGIERRLSRRWTVGVQGSAEGGSIKDPDEPKRGYVMWGMPATAAFDNTDSLLDAVRGARVMMAAAPYVGTYVEEFTVLRARVDASVFIPLAEPDILVLALRGAYGSLWGAGAAEVPPSARFYCGGGGSVRGYAYQSLGPRDSDDKPLGGSSALELGAEARWKITPEWGVTVFLDGGMAYDDRVNSLGSGLRWGAGVGLRYYTAIGPVRFDVATPLTPRGDDAPLQAYISIGQSF
jgi:translocation and assembly module TamA